ncbi:sterol desaturase family protein [Zunongwangia sp. HRR-M8]|uniref:sterol desaturase family protein n=1 Tax=Zunongwangia sp. HRR-M8 TaxID=3015170 RepID=UPI0022DD8727|nr:sterol desaturase family protein [Zunongwangia sp. HRR-M8]WBL21293.1 sterol desaturase family protein [Zunongwangia sp. HRR-M8]
MKKEITLDSVVSSAPDLILYAAPLMIGLALLEFYYSWKTKREWYEKKDFLTSLSIGLVYVLQGLVTKSIMFGLVLWVYNIVPWSIPTNWFTSILCFVILDFCRYWAHRYGHEINFLWATHVTHHNSEKYNLSTSFRLSWTQQIKVIFFIPISFLGFNPIVFFICHQIAVLYQFWIHTELIDRMPKWFSFFFVTPSHHRVHHGRNEQYLDKNYGSTFIIWDRLFGTFEPEREKSIYGIIDQPKHFNPVKHVFHVWVDIFRNMRHAESFKEAVKIFFGPPSSLKKIPKQTNKK